MKADLNMIKIELKSVKNLLHKVDNSLVRQELERSISKVMNRIERLSS